ncbi:hypothetical protein [Lentzea sp. HUAS12]|uniref:hypothetical protein n=1 Tax=Lentzea sp. HUAS12 TaxID=2951806 RepID=UPI0020A20D22|nr:hypothetical protein [Lentzea sp. HUAS12]USX53272.1 hypothetical protein ND450_04005 [Lentzea sp. HUAS12]
MLLANHLGVLHSTLGTLAETFREVAARHGDEPDVRHICALLAQRIDRQAEQLKPVVDRYGESGEPEPSLLRDLQDLYALASFTDITWTVVGQAAQGLRDQELMDVVSACEQDTARQLAWLKTRIKQSAPQALIVAGS